MSLGRAHHLRARGQVKRTQTSERSESHGKGGARAQSTDRVAYRFSSLELLLARPRWETRKQKAGLVFLSQRSGRSSCSTRGHAGDCGAEPGLPGRLFLSAWLLWVSAEGQKYRVLENGYCSQGNGRKKRNGGNEGGRRMGLKWEYCPRDSLLYWVVGWMRGCGC